MKSRLVIMFLASATAWAGETCLLQGELRGDPAYFWTWARDSWTGIVKVTCRDSVFDHLSQWGRPRGTEAIAERMIRYVSWEAGRGAGPSSELRFTLAGLERSQAIALLGTFRVARMVTPLEEISRFASIGIETDQGLLPAQLEQIGNYSSDIKQWLGSGQLSLSAIEEQ